MAVSIKKDENSITARFGISCVDGVTPVPILVTPAGLVKVDNTTVISFVPSTVQATIRDANQATPMCGVSSADGSTVLPVYVNPANGAILVDQ